MKNYSKQREELLNILKNSKTHPTADELYEKLKKEIPSVSKGTVYRNLKELVEEDYIIKISMGDCADRYDFIHNEHNHIICKCCGAVKDFEYSFVSKKLRESIIHQTEAEPFLGGVIVYGVCKKCKGKFKNY